MADRLGGIDYAKFRAAGERGSAPYISVQHFDDGRTPLMLYLAFKLEDEEDFDHHDDPANQVATICAMNDGVYDDHFLPVNLAEVRRQRADG